MCQGPADHPPTPAALNQGQRIALSEGQMGQAQQPEKDQFHPDHGAPAPGDEAVQVVLQDEDAAPADGKRYGNCAPAEEELEQVEPGCGQAARGHPEKGQEGKDGEEDEEHGQDLLEP